MRVCLINPPHLIPKAWELTRVFQPLGLAYIAATTLESGHEISLIDARAEGWEKAQETREKYCLGLGFEKIVERVRKISPDMVGITVPFSMIAQSAFEVARRVKEMDESVITVLGGPHPSVRPIDCVSRPYVDFVVMGEGEHTIVELIKVLEQEAYAKLREVKGIAYKKRGKPRVTPPRTPIQRLDSLPFPARHLLPMDIYFKVAKRGFAPREGLNKPWATMITSRGCPYHCVFCSINLTMGRRWRARSPENVADEIEQLVRTYKVKQIDFEDDNMTLDRRRMERICDLIIQRGLDIEWYTPNGVRADTLDENLLRKMKKSGLKGLWIAPESGVQHVVNQIIKKNLDLRKVEAVITLCKKLNISVRCYFVIGLIGETKENIKATIAYARKLKKLGADGFSFCIATPYYGTELYEQAKKLGYLHETFSDETLSVVEPLIETPEFTVNEIRELFEIASKAEPVLTHTNIMRALRNPNLVLDFLSRKIKQWVFKPRIS